MNPAALVRQRAESQLHPVMLPLLARHRQLAADVGGVRLIETWRGMELQDADYRLGRDSRGEVVDRSKVVTWKRPGASWHNLTRWVRVCPDCQHTSDLHLAPALAADAPVRACSALVARQFSQVAEFTAQVMSSFEPVSCHCAIYTDRLVTGALTRIPASCAYHLALEDDGDEQAGSLEGFGANRLDPKDVARYKRLAEHGRDLGLRAGADWGDFTHFELAGYPLAAVAAVLELQDGRLESLVHPEVA